MGRGEGMREYRPPMREKHVEHKESKENQEFDREVVRVFLLQSRNHNDVYKDIAGELEQGRKLSDIAENYEFTRVILTEKGKQSTKNPGQVMPAGGNINPKETVRRAALREVHEETHLRPMNLEDIGDFSYTHRYKDSDTAEEKKDHVFAHHYTAKVLPTDSPYPLNPKEDKIYKFPTFTPSEMAQFWANGSWQAADREMPLFDNLLATPVRRAMSREEQEKIPSMLTLEEEGQMWKVMGELGEKMRDFEREKKTSIIENMMMYLRFGDNEKKYWLNRLASVQGEEIHEVNKQTNAYREFLKKAEQKYPHKIREAFFASVELSNFEEELEFAGESKLEAVVRFMYTLLELKFPFDIYIEKAKQNPKLQKFAEQMDVFVTSLKEGKGITPSTSHDSKEYRTAFETIDDHLTEFGGDETELEPFIREYFYDAFATGSSEQKRDSNIVIGERLSRLNDFIKKMVEQIEHLAVVAGSRVGDISPIEEVESAGLVSLLQFSVPTARAKTYFNEIDPTTKQPRFGSNIQRELVFEARRSLALLALFGKFDDRFNEIKSLGKEPIERIWGSVFSSSVNETITLTKKRGNTGLESYRESIDTSEHENNGHEDELDDTSKSSSLLRRFTSDSGVSYVTRVSRRDKLIDSFYRKAIVRGFDDPNDIQDVFGRSIIVSSLGEGGKHAMSVETRTLPVWKSGKNKDENVLKDNLVSVKGTYTDSPAVLDLIESYIKKAEEREAKVRIFDYKPNPLPGEKIASSGAGGGGELRFAKFYIEHTDKQGVKRYEEVQVFTPTSEDQTGFYWEEKKKEDDNRYAIDRLMDTKGMRSFIELLWPCGIYGEAVRKIFNKEVVQKGHVARKKG